MDVDSALIRTRIRFLKAQIEAAIRRGEFVLAGILHAALVDEEIGLHMGVR